LDIQQVNDELETDRSQRVPIAGCRFVTGYAITDKPWRYRIEAMALSTADLVSSLGGFLSERRGLALLGI
jgi:hypothetical protein